MSEFEQKPEDFITEFDAAIEAHMEWTRRILRCAVLHISPGDDVMDEMAHTLCHFGRWFSANAQAFEQINSDSVHRVEASHKSMHDAIRSICTNMIEGKAGSLADLEMFEKSQSELLNLLASCKTTALSNTDQIDPLTSLPLRHNLEREFLHSQKEAQRNNTFLHLAMIDVDHFKNINDNYGHPVGDIVLSQLSGIFKNLTRGNDYLYRYGGEEFLWLIRCQNPEQAEQAVRRATFLVRTTPISIDDNKSLSVSITIGLTSVQNDESLASAIKRADFALYEGKSAGRDRYVIG